MLLFESRTFFAIFAQWLCLFFPSLLMKRLFLIVPALLLLEGCIQMIAVRSMEGIMDYGLEAFNEESDLQIAREALGGNLKLIEALIKADPQNEKFLLFAAQGYNAYGMAFAEDDSVERARVFYARGKEYGLRILEKNTGFKEAWDKDDEAFKRALNRFSKDDVPAIFWTASNWFSYINISRTEIAALADISKAAAMMEFVMSKDPSYYYGGAYLFLGAIEGTTPEMLGGKPEKAKEYFEKCLALNRNKFLLADLYYAKTYAVQVQNQELFESLLKKIDDTSIDVLPEARLTNAIAKQKAKLLRAQMNNLF
jgi:tetratricopeptide (TPR) repeat protein